MEVFAVISVLVALLIAGIISEVYRDIPKPYSQRPCMGKHWRARFPKSPKEELRRFLVLFADAFGFGEKDKLRFEPNDKIMDIYDATVGKWDQFIDDWELVDLADDIENEYQVDFGTIWNESLTLGELFNYVTNAWQGVPAETTDRRG